MHNGTLSARLSEPPPAETAPPANIVVLEALALRRCVTAIYNLATVTLAPYILYTRHDALFIDAVTIERDRQRPRETKLGSFKLDGLRGLALTERGFCPEPFFDPEDERYRGTALFTVERC